MSRSLATATPIRVPDEMAWVYDDAPLVGNEQADEYEALFATIAAAINPANFIIWQLVAHLTDLAWYIRRERKIKRAIIKLYHREIVSELLTDIFDKHLFSVSEEAIRWQCDRQARREIDERLTAMGHSPDSVLAQAYVRGADEIEASDRRAAFYEARSIVILREANIYSERLARQIDQASSVIVDGEFADAAE